MDDDDDKYRYSQIKTEQVVEMNINLNDIEVDLDVLIIKKLDLIKQMLKLDYSEITSNFIDVKNKNYEK